MDAMPSRLWFALGLMSGSGVMALVQWLAGSSDGWFAVGLAAIAALILLVDWLTHPTEPPGRVRPKLYVPDDTEGREGRGKP